jgi:hypothetical protein
VVLQRVARLGAAEWEAMGSVKTVREMVSSQATPPVVPPVSIDSEEASEKSFAAALELATVLHTAAASMAASVDASTAASVQELQLQELRQALAAVVPGESGCELPTGSDPPEWSLDSLVLLEWNASLGAFCKIGIAVMTVKLARGPLPVRSAKNRTKQSNRTHPAFCRAHTRLKCQKVWGRQ